MGFPFSFEAFRQAEGFPEWNEAFRFDTSTVERGPRSNFWDHSALFRSTGFAVIDPNRPIFRVFVLQEERLRERKGPIGQKEVHKAITPLFLTRFIQNLIDSFCR